MIRSRAITVMQVRDAEDVLMVVLVVEASNDDYIELKGMERS